MMNRRILVVEDNRDNLMLIVDMLRTLRYEVLTATDGQRGLAVARLEKPDLILMDLALPFMDGWTVAEQIKALPELKHIPIIAVTAHAMIGDRERALRAGCDEYVSKPINVPELAGKISRLLD